MEPIDPNVLVRLDAPSHFEEAEVATIEWQGRPMWSARQVAAALGYDSADQVTVNLSHQWSDELAEGTDYVVVRGDELRALKAAAPGLVDARAPALTLLTESGVHLVALLSRQPKARALRRWLADQVLPRIRRTGGYAAPARLRAEERLTPLAAAVELARLGWSPDEVENVVLATLNIPGEPQLEEVPQLIAGVQSLNLAAPIAAVFAAILSQLEEHGMTRPLPLYEIGRLANVGRHGVHRAIAFLKREHYLLWMREGTRSEVYYLSSHVRDRLLRGAL